MNILQAIDDPAVFGRHFRGSTWNGWRAFLCALFALPMSNDDLAIYRASTGEWFILCSSDLTAHVWQLGSPRTGDLPLPAKY